MNSFLQVVIIADNKSKQIEISHLLKKKQLRKQQKVQNFKKSAAQEEHKTTCEVPPATIWQFILDTGPKGLKYHLHYLPI
jgi:hypothetical protein